VYISDKCEINRDSGVVQNVLGNYYKQVLSQYLHALSFEQDTII